MFPIRILAAFAILLSASYAQAGLIVSQEAEADAHVTASMSVMTEWATSQNDDESTPHVQQSDDLLSSIAVLSGQSDGSQVFANAATLSLSSPKPVGQLALENAILPKSPVLDGLLKPA